MLMLSQLPPQEAILVGMAIGWMGHKLYLSNYWRFADKTPKGDA